MVSWYEVQAGAGGGVGGAKISGHLWMEGDCKVFTVIYLEKIVSSMVFLKVCAGCCCRNPAVIVNYSRYI